MVAESSGQTSSLLIGQMALESGGVIMFASGLINSGGKSTPHCSGSNTTRVYGCWPDGETCADDMVCSAWTTEERQNLSFRRAVASAYLAWHLPHQSIETQAECLWILSDSYATDQAVLLSPPYTRCSNSWIQRGLGGSIIQHQTIPNREVYYVCIFVFMYLYRWVWSSGEQAKKELQRYVEQ